MLISMPEINRGLRGYGFYDGLESVPPIYSGEDTPLAEKMIHARYFYGASEWLIFEGSESGEAFGWTCLNGDESMAEMGYVDLPALESLTLGNGDVIQRDVDWEPQTFGSYRDSK